MVAVHALKIFDTSLMAALNGGELFEKGAVLLRLTMIFLKIGGKRITFGHFLRKFRD